LVDLGLKKNGPRKNVLDQKESVGGRTWNEKKEMGVLRIFHITSRCKGKHFGISMHEEKGEKSVT